MSEKNDDCRKRYLSGSQKRKKKIVQQKKLKKMGNSLDRFVKTLNSSSVNVNSQDGDKHAEENSLENHHGTTNTTSSDVNSVEYEDKNKNILVDENSNQDASFRSKDDESNFDLTEKLPDDPALWTPDMISLLQEKFCKFKPKQNIEYLHTSTRLIGNKERKLSENNFFMKKKNNELVPRDWLIFSPSTCSVYCYLCKLFSTSNQALCASGYTDWKNVTQRLSEHEKSPIHREAACSFSRLCKSSERIDRQLICEYETECQYWQNVLRRVVAVIKFLSQRGLPMFGSDETLYSKQNGNFLGILELISHFDQFIANHISKYANSGSGHINYLSSTTVNEIVVLMADKVLNVIINEIIEAKYYGIIVDSTPDVSHVDQLAVVIRYIDEHGESVEHFVKFLPIHSHSSSNLCETLLNFLNSLQIDIKNCRGQSYDNASNMAGRYSGLQARIKELSPLAEYVPCAAHSLNLVGSVAAECCNQVISFFGFVQNLYNFFSVSTHRWNILIKSLSEVKSGYLTLKNLSQTRWSSHASAINALKKGYVQIKAALKAIFNDEEEKQATRFEAKMLFTKMEKLETVILIIVWHALLQRIDKVSVALQNVSCSLSSVVSLYESLVKFVQVVRENFSVYETEAYQLLGEVVNYSYKRKRKTPKSKMLDESSTEESCFTEREAFIFQCHYMLCDSLLSELNKRKESYVCMEKRFGFLYENYDSDSKEKIYSAAKEFQSIYYADIDDEFPEEFIHFKHFLTDCDPQVQLKTLRKIGIQHTFPNVDTSLRIYLSMPISNASSERCFSTLKRIKSNFRSTLNQKKLNSLSLLSIESDITTRLEFDDVISCFAQKKCRKKPIC